MIAKVLIAVALAIINSEKNLRDDFQCTHNDTNTLFELTTVYLMPTSQNVSNYVIDPLDPLPTMDFAKEWVEPNHIQIYTRNNKFLGVRNGVASSVSFYCNNSNTVFFEVRGNFPNLTLLGDYDVRIKAMFKYFRNNGKFSLSFNTDFVMKFSSSMLKIKNNGSVYHHIKAASLESIINNRMEINFNDKILNKWLADGHQAIKNLVDDLFGKALQTTVQRTFDDLSKIRCLA